MELELSPLDGDNSVKGSNENLYEYNLESDEEFESGTPSQSQIRTEQQIFMLDIPTQKMEISSSDNEISQSSGFDTVLKSSVGFMSYGKYCTYCVVVGLLVLGTYLGLSNMVIDNKKIASPNSPQHSQKFTAPGFVSNIQNTFLSGLEGCWKTCFQSEFGTPLISHFLDECQGNWLFFYTIDKYSSDENMILAGAFTRKSVFLSSNVQNHSCTNYGADCVVRGFLEGGVYWYHQTCPEYGYSSVGFSTKQDIVLTWDYEYVDIGYHDTQKIVQQQPKNACSGSLSWSLADRSRSPSAVNCIPSQDPRYKQIVMTNSCPLPDIVGLN